MDTQLIDRFTHFAEEAERKYGVVCQLADIRGARWSYVAGPRPVQVPASEPMRIALSPDTGIVVYDLRGLNGGDLDKVRQEALSFAAQDAKPGKEEIIHYLNTRDAGEIEKLFRKADAVRKKYVGDEVHLRGIIEFSNHCTRDCLYCGLRRSNAARFRYRMSIDEIFETAREARALGFMTVVLQSGEDRHYKTADICALISRIKKELDLAVTLSIGELPREDYAKLREAGADRYLIRFETSDPELFTCLKPDSDHARRIEILNWLRELGFQVGSGIMAGLPGQTPASIADDILLFDRLELDMIGSGPFIPNPETPLKDSSGGDLTTALKVVALTRLVTLDAHIPATTALGSLDPEGRQKALKCGANVIMPNVTPRKYRKHYLLYPGKICTDDSPQDCRGCMEAMLASMGRTISTGYGHSLKSGYVDRLR